VGGWTCRLKSKCWEEREYLIGSVGITSKRACKALFTKSTMSLESMKLNFKRTGSNLIAFSLVGMILL